MKVDGKKVPINPNLKGYPGLISFYIPAGIHHISVEFHNTPLRNYALGISLITSFLRLHVVYRTAKRA